MAASDEKIAELIKAILDRTKSHEVVWKKTSDPSTFLAVFPKYIVELEGPDFNATFRLQGEDGETIDEISWASMNIYARQLLKELVVTARRQALGTDEAIDELLKSLSGKK